MSRRRRPSVRQRACRLAVATTLLTILGTASPIAMAQPAAPVPAASGLVPQVESDRAQALTLYEDCRWAEAYAVFAALADGGDARASQVALLMARHGPRLYGREFPITDLQAATWAHRAIQAVVAARER